MNDSKSKSIVELEKQIEELKFQLLQQSVEIDDFFNNSPCGYINLDTEGNILQVNVTFLDWLGYSKKQILAKEKFLSLLEEESEFYFTQKFRNLLEGSDIRNLELCLLTKKGESLYVSLSGKMIFVPKEQRSIVKFSAFDITEKKKIEHALKEKTKKVLHQNEIMKNDLNLAAKIQSAFLPKENSIENIATLYLPLDKVGGDFFDFIHFRDKNKLGVFISDVAGHGIPSAFITAILKSAIHQSSPDLKENPSEFLFNLNEYLIEFANGNFVTAMYAVIDFSKKEMHYSHAGHPYPFLFAKNSVSELSINHKRKPLGILDRESLEATGKSYVTEKIDLSEYSKILFFTDGLMEAMRYEKEEEVYYEERLTSLIHMHKDQLSQGLLELIVSDLKEFINGTSLQDDICIIAVDLFKQ